MLPDTGISLHSPTLLTVKLCLRHPKLKFLSCFKCLFVLRGDKVIAYTISHSRAFQGDYSISLFPSSLFIIKTPQPPPRNTHTVHEAEKEYRSLTDLRVCAKQHQHHTGSSKCKSKRTCTEHMPLTHTDHWRQQKTAWLASAEQVSLPDTFPFPLSLLWTKMIRTPSAKTIIKHSLFLPWAI